MAAQPPAIFLDVFRRADKNDDDKISVEEFHQFFSDGVVSQADLNGVFKAIDQDGNQNIDTQELCNYFMQSYAPYADLYASCEAMNAALHKALTETAKTYSSADFIAKFRIRFFLKEALAQLQSIVQPLDMAIDRIEAETRAAMPSAPFNGGEVKADPVVASLRAQSGRRGSAATSNPPAVGGGQAQAIDAQIKRLAKLVDRFEADVRFKLVDEESSVAPDLTIVSRSFKAQADRNGYFRDSMIGYLEESRKAEGCFHLSVRTAGSLTTTVFEIWRDKEALSAHYLGETWRTFQRHCADNLAEPSSSSSLSVPSSWWTASFE